jgi:hypothetical protein
VPDRGALGKDLFAECIPKNTRQMFFLKNCFNLFLNIFKEIFENCFNTPRIHLMAFTPQCTFDAFAKKRSLFHVVLGQGVFYTSAKKIKK